MVNSSVGRAAFLLLGLLAVGGPAHGYRFIPRTVSGTVFADQNGNGRREASEAGVAGVLVSNGVELVPTDSRGRYHLSTRPGRLVFVVKPRGYAPAQPTSWYYPPTAAPRQTADFALRPAAEKNAHDVVLLGDIQAGSQDDLYHFNHLVTEELYDDPYAFALTLGDITFDELSVYPKTKASLKALGKPVYAVFGNHDQNYEVQQAAYADSTYQRYFGPSYYALQYGSTHVVVLNDVAYLGQKKYEGRVSAEQLTFLTNYLQHSAPQQLHVLAMHIPLGEVVNKADLLRVLAKHPNVAFISAHEHRNRREYHAQPSGTTWQEVVVGATCGSWWQGEHDIFGIPSALMNCGAPKGYWKLRVGEQNDYQLAYKTSQYPATFQMSVWTPEDSEWDPAQNLPADSTRNVALINVFAGSSKTRVEFRLNDGAWQPAYPVVAPDPYLARIYQLQRRRIYPTAKASALAGRAEPSPHLWRARLPDNLPVGTHKIEVRATDPYGLQAQAYRVLTINPPSLP
ncbi:hypothetical protein DNI29_16420 [Hymenobacter sediminis]|uniref:calcineurin-like phosphoesterase C-terminal domain-containing protein n=1 Tax=Hymenobacter sediminis TaxID=2218621 RepID=UPI000DA6B4BF|nr:calcineurin-like phosphoesterase family protein [Hymenobacter sediminis]RPD45741.1 hypothetical protein DNI29_16420 [Hymenobacter sediminis]